MSNKTINLLAGGLLYAASARGQHLPSYDASKYQKKADIQKTAPYALFLDENGFERPIGSVPDFKHNSTFYKDLPNKKVCVLRRIGQSDYFVEVVGSTRTGADFSAKTVAQSLERLTDSELEKMDRKGPDNNVIEILTK